MTRARRVIPRAPILLLAAIELPSRTATPTDLNARATKAPATTFGPLHFKGLTAPVNVLRDRWGVAHIYAHN